jgi:predicted ester cyclase
MSVADNKALVRRYFDRRWNDKDYSVIDELIDPSLASEIEGHKAWLDSVHAAIGGLQLTMDDLIGEDDQVVVPWTVTGVHQGEYLGVAPTGQQVTFRGLALLRIADGKIVSDVAYGDNLAVLLNRAGH